MFICTQSYKAKFTNITTHGKIERVYHLLERNSGRRQTLMISARRQASSPHRYLLAEMSCSMASVKMARMLIIILETKN